MPASGSDTEHGSTCPTRLLQDPSLAVQSCEDVYRGLALLGRKEGPRCAAVVVSTVGLGRDEMEFFSIAPRVSSGVPVYVYGGARDEPTIARALQLGATGRLTEHVVNSLIEHAAHARRTQPLPNEERRSAAGDEEEQPAADTAQAPDDDSDESDGPAVRVPWSRFTESPIRTPPIEAPPAVPDPAARGFTVSAESREPLLTPEELRALLSDEDDSTPFSPTPDEAPWPTTKNQRT